VIRHTSEFEHAWLVDLVRKHGDDLTAMARDRKGNVWQKTPGELKRACVLSPSLSLSCLSLPRSRCGSALVSIY